MGTLNFDNPAQYLRYRIAQFMLHCINVTPPFRTVNIKRDFKIVPIGGSKIFARVDPNFIGSTFLSGSEAMAIKMNRTHL